MKTWVVMYSIIWMAFFDIMLVLFITPMFSAVNMAVHLTLGVGVLALAFVVRREVRKTACPNRIKLITGTTFNLAVVQAVLGLALAAGLSLSWGGVYTTAVNFVHAALSLAIITQTAASATAFDMWEEKEFQAQA